MKIKKIGRKDGYINCHIFCGKRNGKKIYKLKLEHRLIAAAFLGKSKLEVNHKNGDKSDNRIENLEYVTRAENIAHARNVIKTWSPPPSGFESNSAKISKEDHDRIFRWYTDKVLLPDQLSVFFNVSMATIMRHIRLHKSLNKTIYSRMYC